MPRVRQSGAPSGAPSASPVGTDPVPAAAAPPSSVGEGVVQAANRSQINFSADITSTTAAPVLQTNPYYAFCAPPPPPPLLQEGRMPIQPGVEMVESRIDYDQATEEYVVTATYQMRVQPQRDDWTHTDRITVPQIPYRVYGVSAEARYRHEAEMRRQRDWQNRYQTLDIGALSTTVTIDPYWPRDQIGITSGTGSYYLSDPLPPLTPEEQQRRERRRQAELAAKRKATKRGRTLLLRCLSEEQQREYATSRMFVVEAADGRRFRLRKNRTAELLGPDGQALSSYCIHLSGTYIPEDTLIAQKLLLETDPASFERIANITPLRVVPGLGQSIVSQANINAYFQRDARPALTDADRARHLQEYYRDSRAMLRAEGIADPDAWVEGVRQQIRTAQQQGAVFEPGGAGARSVAAEAIYEEELFRQDQAAETIGRMLEELEGLPLAGLETQRPDYVAPSIAA